MAKISVDRTASTSAPADLVFSTTNNVDTSSNGGDGNITERLRIKSDGNIQIPNDTGILQLGASQDLEIYHSGSHSYIQNTTNFLFIHSNSLALRSATQETFIDCSVNGSVDLYYDGVKKLETTSTGTTVTGTVTATSFSGDGIIPAGGIIIWSGASNAIPTGWLICDGTNSTPDLRNRFVVGAGSTYSVGATGGSDSVTLTTAQIPSHNHPIQIRVGVDDDNFSFNQGFSSDKNDSGGTFNSNNTGGGQSHENRPPYYALCYIMKS